MDRKANERRDRDAELDELNADPELPGLVSGGQSGDTQGLASEADASDESVEELAQEDQAYEAEVVEGVEDAENHPERPVRSHEDRQPVLENELPSDPDWK